MKKVIMDFYTYEKELSNATQEGKGYAVSKVLEHLKSYRNGFDSFDVFVYEDKILIELLKEISKSHLCPICFINQKETFNGYDGKCLDCLIKEEKGK